MQLLDETCASIDPVSSAKFEQTIVGLRPDHATVLVTQDPQAAVRVSDSVGFMHPGEMLEFGTVQGVFQTPKGDAHGACHHRRFGSAARHLQPD